MGAIRGTGSEWGRVGPSGPAAGLTHGRPAPGGWAAVGQKLESCPQSASAVATAATGEE
jgi:hypothetical protein